MRGEIPEGRCGFTLEAWDVEGVPSSGKDLNAWYKGTKASCCWRKPWHGYDRCIWHADISEKLGEALARARTQHPERLDGAVLRESRLGGTVSFESCSLRGADLTGTNLRFADLADADLQNIRAMGAEFGGATLRDGDLRGADLGGSDLRDVDLTGANLNGANLREADLRGSDLRGASLVGASLREANLEEADLHGADLRRCDLQRAGLRRVVFTGADLTDADLQGADLMETDFTGAVLRDADLGRTNLHRVTLRDADLRGVRLASADYSFFDFPFRQLRSNPQLLFQASLFGTPLSDTGNLIILFGLASGLIALGGYPLGVFGPEASFWLRVSAALGGAGLVLMAALLQLRMAIRGFLEVADVFP